MIKKKCLNSPFFLAVINTLEENLWKMAHRIQLDPEDQLLLMNLLAESFEYKMRKLRRSDSITSFQNYYIDAIEKLRDNHIEVNHSKKNLFFWIKDNLAHSGDKIWNSRQCQQALEIIDSCCKNSYTRYRLQKTAGNLFNYDYN